MDKYLTKPGLGDTILSCLLNSLTGKSFDKMLYTNFF